MKCGLWRDVPLKYRYNYEKFNWKENFRCSRLKLKGLICNKPYSFKQEAYD